MESKVLLAFVTAIVLILTISRFFKTKQSSSGRMKTTNSLPVNKVSDSMVKLIESLKSTLPEEVVLCYDRLFNLSTENYWAQQECENTPACIIQPHNSEQVCAVVALLHAEYEQKGKHNHAAATEGLFAVRGGGHSAVAGAASTKGGILLDLSHLNEVKISDDRKTVMVGAGARWTHVSSLLDKEGLAAVGGRNSRVGVGGLTLGGGLSFFSPRFGLVCSNVIEYEIVLASGKLVTASASRNSDLWQALKGGANNFGVVTRFKLRCFPCGEIWAGWTYMPNNNLSKVLAAFHKSVANANPRSPTHDKYAAGPIACFTYLQGLPFQVVSVHLAYTKPSEIKGKWPSYWKSTSFPSMWRFWSNCKMRTLTSATDELEALNPPGRRQALGTITVQNDLSTLTATHAVYNNAIATISRVKGISWTLVMQPLVPQWARGEGDNNPLGLDEGPDDPLVIVSFTVNWANAKDDEFVKSETQRAVKEMEVYAEEHETAHRYRYLNYCEDWQDSFKSYGENNREFLREVSKKYDPSGLFQKGCAGGIKLWP